MRLINLFIVPSYKSLSWISSEQLGKVYQKLTEFHKSTQMMRQVWSIQVGYFWAPSEDAPVTLFHTGKTRWVGTGTRAAMYWYTLDCCSSSWSCMAVNAAPAPSGIDATSAFISSWSAAVAAAVTRGGKNLRGAQPRTSGLTKHKSSKFIDACTSTQHREHKNQAEQKGCIHITSNKLQFHVHCIREK
jgi:hypothetical protein